MFSYILNLRSIFIKVTLLQRDSFDCDMPVYLITEGAAGI